MQVSARYPCAVHSLGAGLTASELQEAYLNRVHASDAELYQVSTGRNVLRCGNVCACVCARACGVEFRVCTNCAPACPVRGIVSEVSSVAVYKCMKFRMYFVLPVDPRLAI